jgi:hypothetical protein
MSGLNSLLMTGIDDEIPLTKFFPLNYVNENTLTELLIISKSFKNCGKGSLQNKNKIFYYRTYIPTLPVQEDNSSVSHSFSDYYIYSYDCNKKKIFLLYYCDLNYKKKDIDSLTNKIMKILDTNPFDGHDLKREACVQINSLFEQYQKLSPNLGKINPLIEVTINESSGSINNVSIDSERSRKSLISKKRIDSRIIFPKKKRKKTEEVSVDIDDLTTIKEDDSDLSIMFKNNLDEDINLAQINKWKNIQMWNFGLCSSLFVIMIVCIIVLYLLK